MRAACAKKRKCESGGRQLTDAAGNVIISIGKPMYRRRNAAGLHWRLRCGNYRIVRILK